MKSKPKLVFIVGTLGKGGAERQLYYTVSVLEKLGYNIDILCLSKNAYWGEKIIELGIKIYFIEHHYFKLIRLYHLYKIIRDNNYDIIYSSHSYTNIYATIISKILSIPNITSIRSDYLSEEKASGKLITYFSLSFSSTTIANSKAAITNGKNRLKNHNWVKLSNAIDLDEFNGNFIGDNSFELDKNKINVLIVSRLTKEKRVDFFLEIIHDLKNRSDINERFISYIAGTGRDDEDLTAELVHMSKELGLNEEDVIFLGNVDDMPALYNNCDILILTSEYEGLPNCVIEASASGLPVVANDVGGVNEIIVDNVTGFLIPPFNKEEFMEKLIYLINDKKKRIEMGSKGRSYVRKNFSIENNIKSLINIFENISN